MNVYTAPSLLDVTGALEALPGLSLTTHGRAAGRLAASARKA